MGHIYLVLQFPQAAVIQRPPLPPTTRTLTLSIIHGRSLRHVVFVVQVTMLRHGSGRGHGFAGRICPLPTCELQAHHALLHTWVALVRMRPSLQLFVERRIAALCVQPRKTWLPDLGEFLVYIAARTTPWNTLAAPLLQELLDRNVKWLLRRHGGLVHTAGPLAPSDGERLRCSMLTSKVSYQIVMIQAFFARHVARACSHSEAESCTTGICLQAIVDRFSGAYGQPTNTTWALLEFMWRQTGQLTPTAPVPGFRRLFQALGLPACWEEDEASVAGKLRAAVGRSRAKGYHTEAQETAAVLAAAPTPQAPSPQATSTQACNPEGPNTPSHSLIDRSPHGNGTQVLVPQDQLNPQAMGPQVGASSARQPAVVC